MEIFSALAFISHSLKINTDRGFNIAEENKILGDDVFMLMPFQNPLTFYLSLKWKLSHQRRFQSCVGFFVPTTKA